MGDMDARFGNSVTALPGKLGCEQYSYTDKPDQIQSNDNADALFGLCAEERMLIVIFIIYNVTKFSLVT